MTSPAPDVSPDLDAMFRALAEPRRRAILRLVADTERPAGEIAAAFEVSRTAVSQHLTVLRESGSTVTSTGASTTSRPFEGATSTRTVTG